MFSQAQVAPGNLPFPRFTAADGRVDTDGMPLSGASLCILPEKASCFTMPSRTQLPPSGVTYDFGLEPRAERWPLASGGSWIFFSSMFSGGGSGTLTRVAMLRYEPDGKIANLMPYIAATNVSDFAMWSVPAASRYPVFVEAEFVWGNGESHFGPHYYDVTAWTFDPRTDRYVKAFQYRTSKRYDSDADRIRVLKPEHDEILRRLEKAH
ncbi:MAG TPA: hypothetical protein VGN16_16185 [Acidobacteriaceae bacterium]